MKIAERTILKYSERNLTDIIKLMSESKMRVEAAIEVVMNPNEEVLSIAEKVKEYFEIDTMVAKTRKHQELIPIAIFSYLVSDLLKDPEFVRVYSTVINLTKRDRTSFLHYVRQFKEGYHLVDNRLFKEDSVTNHFLRIKEKITGEDYSHLNIKPIIPEVIPGGRCSKVLHDRSEEIDKDIENGATFKYLNDEYFNYSSTHEFKRILKRQYEEVFSRVKQGNESRFSKLYRENRERIDTDIARGMKSGDLNALYFDYGTTHSLLKIMKTSEPDLYYRLKRN